MNVIEEAVSIKEAVKVFGIIEKVLKKQMSTQVIMANALYEELYHNGPKYNVHHSHLVKTSHYNEGEEWLKYSTDDLFDRAASFIPNSTDYMQLVQFKSDKLNYTHFKEGFKHFLIIEVKK